MLGFFLSFLAATMGVIGVICLIILVAPFVIKFADWWFDRWLNL